MSHRAAEDAGRERVILMDLRIGYRIKLVSDKLKNHADADLGKIGLTFAQSQVMSFLAEHDRQATQKEIEQFLEVSHPTVVGIVGRMKKRGLVETWQDTQDRRNKIVRLSDRAFSLSEKMERSAAESEKMLTRSLSEEEKKELCRLLGILWQNVSEDEVERAGRDSASVHSSETAGDQSTFFPSVT